MLWKKDVCLELLELLFAAESVVDVGVGLVYREATGLGRARLGLVLLAVGV